MRKHLVNKKTTQTTTHSLDGDEVLRLIAEALDCRPEEVKMKYRYNPYGYGAQIVSARVSHEVVLSES